MSTPPVAAPIVPAAAGGRGEGRGMARRGYRGRGGRGTRTGTGRTTPARSTFKGNTSDMNGNVFQCHGERKDSRQFKKTMDSLEEYAKKNVQNPADLAPLFGNTIEAPALEMPEDPIAEDDRDAKGKPTGTKKPLTATATMLWQEEVKDYFKRKRDLKTSIATIYAVAWGQCSEAMKAKLKSLDEYEENTKTNECAWLLNSIQGITLQFDEKKNGFISLLDARASFLNCKQSSDQTADEYLETLRAWADAIEYCGGSVAENYKATP